jgi:hypothetical protein
LEQNIWASMRQRSKSAVEGQQNGQSIASRLLETDWKTG